MTYELRMGSAENSIAEKTNQPKKQSWAEQVENQEEETPSEKNENYWKLSNLRICDLCQLDSFICEFNEYYYGLTIEQKIVANDLFFQKLPKTVHQQVSENFQAALQANLVPNSLGGRTFILKNWLTRQCSEETAKREAKIQLCCDKQQGVGKYGCHKDTYRIKKKKWKKIPYNEYRQRKRRNPRKFFRNRKQHRKKFPKKSDKYCPTGKRKCRCWSCQEEGHYANECPKRQKSETSALRSAFDLGYEPIEDSEIDSEIEIYGLETDYSSNESEDYP